MFTVGFFSPGCNIVFALFQIYAFVGEFTGGLGKKPSAATKLKYSIKEAKCYENLIG